VVFVGISLIPAYLAGKSLERGRDSVNSGKRALLSLQEGSNAAEAFAVAEASFREASRWADNPFIRLEGLIPILGRTPDAIGRLARAGERIAVAGSALSEGVSALPGGLPGLAPRDGRIPVETIQTITPAISLARRELEGSAREIQPIASAFVVPPVSDAITLVQTELSDALTQIRAADAILTGLPQLAGVHGKQRYFVAAENPAELRGTGGIIGFYSIMTIEDGRIHIGPFHDKPPPDLPQGSVQGPPGYGPPYQGFGSPTIWLDVNAVPDAPTAAEMIERLWRKVKGQPLDGVMFVTPQALQSLLAALGPVEIPKLDYTVTSENVVQFTTNKAFFLLNKKQSLRNRALGIVAQTVLERFFATNRPKPAVQALVTAASNGYIVLHAADDDVQAGFAQARIDGKFAPAGGDFFSVVANNIAGNKVDYYVERSVDYDVSLLAGGSATAKATVKLSNTAPSKEGYNEALGPYPIHRKFPKGLQLSSGEDYSFLTFYCSSTCRPSPGKRDPDAVDALPPLPLGGANVFATEARLKSKHSQTFDLSLQATHAWSGDDVGGTYRLRFQSQPTINPASVRLSIHLPHGMRMVSANVPITFRSDTLVWEGSLGRVQDIQIRFERPLLEKLWIRTIDFLTRPVFRIG
jgi:hypothetical protein